MKVLNLYEAVSKLGFEDSLEDAKAFYHALNRATVQINALRPHLEKYDISKRPLENCIPNSDFAVREVFENIEYSVLGAKAFYFEAMGEGKCEIFYEDEGEYVKVREIEYNDRGFTAYRGIIEREDGGYPEGEVMIKFSGEYVSSIRNVALYDRLLGSDPERIPAYEPFTAYDMKELSDDFLTFADNPVELDGYRILDSSYRIEGQSRILLPYELSGTVRVRYNRRVAELSYSANPTEDDREIDLDEELCTLLPLLVASYVWLDDEPEKAAHYYSLYSERTKEIVYRTKNISPGIYETNGW